MNSKKPRCLPCPIPPTGSRDPSEETLVRGAQHGKATPASTTRHLKLFLSARASARKARHNRCNPSPDAWFAKTGGALLSRGFFPHSRNRRRLSATPARTIDDSHFRWLRDLHPSESVRQISWWTLSEEEEELDEWSQVASVYAPKRIRHTPCAVVCGFSGSVSPEAASLRLKRRHGELLRRVAPPSQMSILSPKNKQN